jgi:dolichyl-phosphate beta-glucosyltransferase
MTRTTAIVIPCYNEENRLNINNFRTFLMFNPNYHLCFVNDGSTDNTATLLNNLRKGFEQQISVYHCTQNGGKAEAVRQGMMYVLENSDHEYIGFLDADLSTDFVSFDQLVQQLDQQPQVKLVVGSRVKRLGAEITRTLKRHLIGRTIATIIGIMLEMPIYDTQCGAKVFRREIVKSLFQNSFNSKWLFDVELFFRLRNSVGIEKATAWIYEHPLQRWVHVGDSKISVKDSIKIPLHLSKIALTYRFMPYLKDNFFSFTGTLNWVLNPILNKA